MLAHTHIYCICIPTVHILLPSHLCMHWADKYCGSFSPWQSTVKNWGVIIALGGSKTRMAKYAWLPPKLRCCVMKYGRCRQGLPCDSFLVTFSLAFFFFSPPSLHPFTLLFWHFHLCSPVSVVIEGSPSKHLLPLNTYLSYNVIIMEAKSSLIEYSSPHQNGGQPNIPLFYNLICGFISINRVYREDPDNKELSKSRGYEHTLTRVSMAPLHVRNVILRIPSFRLLPLSHRNTNHSSIFTH